MLHGAIFVKSFHRTWVEKGGKRRPDGLIVGERFTRTIKRQPGTLAVKSSHWDNQGKIGRRLCLIPGFSETCMTTLGQFQRTARRATPDKKACSLR